MQATSSTMAKLFIIPCFALTSCKETESMKKDVESTTAQIQMLQNESASMDTQMIELRKFLPPTVATEPLIKQFSAKLAVEVVGIENEIARVKTSLVEAETQLASARKDLETIRGLSK
jgi:hypothetical protein